MKATRITLEHIHHNLKWVVIISAIFLLLLFIHRKLYGYAYDDAYIHFRIVENWINFGLPYFNVTESVKASSSSGWLVFLFLIYRTIQIFSIDIDLPLTVAVINSFTIIVGTLIFYLLVVRVSKSVSQITHLIAFSIIYISLTINSSLGLMETTITIAIAGIAFHLLFSGKKICFTLFSLAIFFRLEMGVLFIIIAIYSLYSNRFNKKDIIIYSVIGIIPFVIFDFFYYGTLIPNTIQAKSTIYTVPLLNQIGVIISRIGNSYRLLPRYAYFSKLYLFPIIFIPLIVLCTYIYQLIRSQRNIIGINGILFLFWGIAIISVYLISKVLIFSWYEPLFTIPIFLVIFSFLTVQQDGKYSFIAKSLIISIVIIQSIALLQIMYAAFSNPAFLPGFSEGARTRQYLSIGKDLYKEYPRARLMTSEIGGLGYGFRGYILDSAGLVSPEALKYPGISNSGGNIITDFIEDTKPDIIVSYDIFIDEEFTDKNSGNYISVSYPVFTQEDISRSIITTPWGDSYERTIWGAGKLFVFISKKFD